MKNMSDYLVRCEALRKDFKRRTVLDGCDLNVVRHEKLALLGESGSGKTTLLRILAGLEYPSSGAVRFSESEGDSRPSTRMVFQKPAIYPHMTVRQNLAFPLHSRGLRMSQIAARTEELAVTLGIEHLLEQSAPPLTAEQEAALLSLTAYLASLES